MPAIIAVLLLLAGFNQPAPTYQIDGAVMVGAEFVVRDGASCVGTSDVADIRPYVYVIAYDEDWQVADLTSLSYGKIEPETGACRFTFTLDHLPLRHVYHIEVGSWRFAYTRADLVRWNWHLTLGIGY